MLRDKFQGICIKRLMESRRLKYGLTSHSFFGL